jgi:hypothetical protein
MDFRDSVARSCWIRTGIRIEYLAQFRVVIFFIIWTLQLIFPAIPAAGRALRDL